MLMHQKQYLKNYAEEFSKKNGIKIQSKHWGGTRKLSMEGIAVEYFPSSIDNGNNNEKYELFPYISDDN